MADRNVVIQGLIELHLKGEGGDQAVASMKKIMAQAKEVETAIGGVGAATRKAADGTGALERCTASNETPPEAREIVEQYLELILEAVAETIQGKLPSA